MFISAPDGGVQHGAQHMASTQSALDEQINVIAPTSKKKNKLTQSNCVQNCNIECYNLLSFENPCLQWGGGSVNKVPTVETL